ncbi:hypothetical protein ROZALSC1DRAFT_26232, partial [Rozella allomycis CSF55]
SSEDIVKDVQYFIGYYEGGFHGFIRANFVLSRVVVLMIANKNVFNCFIVSFASWAYWGEYLFVPIKIIVYWESLDSRSFCLKVLKTCFMRVRGGCVIRISL